MPANKNDALGVNPFVVNGRTVDIHITTNGSDWYWAVMSLMGTTMLVILGTALMRPAPARIFHYILAAAAFVATVTHYSMASNLGWVPIDVEFQRMGNPLVSGINRQIWWVRYCGWYVQSPSSLTAFDCQQHPAGASVWGRTKTTVS
jgi:bacteriorhodopsin